MPHGAAGAARGGDRAARDRREDTSAARSLSRRAVLAAGGAALLASASAAPTLAAAPKPAPAGDDAGFLAFLAAAEKVSADLYHRALALGGAFDAGERRRLSLVAAGKREAIRRVTGPLGADAPQAGDFGTAFPAAATRTRAGVLALAEKLERLTCGVELNGVADAADPATRLLLGRLLAADSQALSTVRVLAGKPAATGLLAPVDLEAAGDALDAYLTAPTAPAQEDTP